MRVLTGIKPTGALQIGNYLGAVRPLLRRDPADDVVVFVADLHALTVEHDPAELQARTLDLARTLLACGVERLFVQSSVPAHTELAYLLESTATYGEMARMVQFKEKSAGRSSFRLLLLTYPALMAADVLAHRVDVVPVGEDQLQHLELTATLARRFNHRYGETFTVPRGELPVGPVRVKDLRDPTGKMGKSGADGSGVVFLSDPPDVLASKVKRAVTDSIPELFYDPELRAGVANLATLLGALTDRSPADALLGLHGSGELKEALTQALVETLTPIQQRRRSISDTELQSALRGGTAEVTPTALDTVARARAAIGL